jgi:reactive intermediate/imine deaminase
MVGPDTLVQLSVVAIPAGGERVVVLPGGWMKPASPYSYGIKSGNTLFLAGLINRSGRDGATIPGDIAAQTKLVMENGAAILQAAGMSLSDVVSSRIFLSDPADFQNMNAAYRPFFPSAPPARATVKAGLPAGAAIEVSMVAVKDASRTAVIPPNADGTPGRAGGNLSPAIQVGKRLYVAGMTGGTQTNTGDVKAQTTEVLARLGRTLKAAGYDWSHVVEEIGYLPEVSRTPEMDAARRDVYSTNYPARVLLGTPLMGGNSIVEIMLTAVK